MCEHKGILQRAKRRAGREASGETEPAASFSLGFQPPELGENQSPPVCHPVCGIVMAALANLDITFTSLTNLVDLVLYARDCTKCLTNV